MLNAIWAVLGEANRYFDAEAPWTVRKTDEARFATIMWVTAEVLRNVGILIQPVMPGSAAKLLDLLALDEAARDFAHLGEAGKLAGGVALPAPVGIFPRYVEKAAS